MKIERKTYSSPRGEITVWHLENETGAWAEVSTLGAGIVGVGVPDRNGKIENVALSYADPADYIADGPCLGKCPGRYANRIAKGHLDVDGKVYQLAINNGPNHLHGGPEGFQNQIWKSREVQNGVEFEYRSHDGEENYPGDLVVKATYKWGADNKLTLSFEAVADKKTVINMTNHAYWNLRGADSGTALDHEMRMKASRWLPTDENLIPTGELASVEGTPMDFREFKPLGSEIKADFPALNYGKGYDNCWAIDGWQPGRMSSEAVVIREAVSGRCVTIDSDQPGVQVYTGNWLAGSPKNHAGRSYEDYEGVAVEMQGFPDAPNEPNFPSQSLTPGEVYRRTITFHFTVD
jgi:aldose 1-epimerase